MDPITLVQFLTPCLPFLLKMGEETAKAVAKKVGEDGWQKTRETAANLWTRIHPKAQEDTKLMEAAQDVAKAQEALSVLPETADLKPASEELEDYQRIFARRLKTLLDANPDLAMLAQTTVNQMAEIEGKVGNIHQIARRGDKVQQDIKVKQGGEAGDLTQEA